VSPRILLLTLLIVGDACVFITTVIILAKVMPSPLEGKDWLIIGAVATLLSMLVLFFAVTRTMPGREPLWFRRARRVDQAGESHAADADSRKSRQ
jgi:hypothetical protein